MKNSGFYILKKELREMFRDKKSLAMMLIIPIMIPLLVIGMSALFESQMNKPIESYNKIGFDYEMSEMEQGIIKEIGIDSVKGSREEMEEQYDAEELDLYITKEGDTYTIHGTNNETTTYALRLAEAYLSVYKEYLQKEYLDRNEIAPETVVDIITVETNITEEENFFADYVTIYAFLFILMSITVSATYPATDTTAGEKERGTLETLLTFPIRSRDIILGKFLSVTISSVITGILSLILTVVSLLVANHMFEIYEGVDLMLSPIALVFAAVVIIAYSLLISGLCIAIASNSKTFKEAQSALTPLTFLSIFPGMIAMMMEIETNAVLALIPFLNYTLVFTDLVHGIVNYGNILLMLLSTVAIITVVLVVIIRQYKSEKVLFSQ